DDRFERVKHVITAHNAVQGGRCGFSYGELFALPQPVGAGDLMSVVYGAKGASVAPVPLPGQPPPAVGNLIKDRDGQERKEIVVMPNELFVQHFPEIGKAETRSLNLADSVEGVPAGSYGFVESYCTERGCDCRRVLLQVITPETGRVAVVSYGFDRN